MDDVSAYSEGRSKLSEEVLVPVADDLRSIRRIAEGADAQLTSMLRRLEL